MAAGDGLLDDLVATLARIAAREAGDGMLPIERASCAQSETPLGETGKPTRRKKAAPKESDTTLAPTTHITTPAPQPLETLHGVPTGEDGAVVGQQRPLTLREIADFLTVSEDVARYLLRKKKIKGFKAGGQWRAMPDALTEYVIEQLSKQ